MSNIMSMVRNRRPGRGRTANTDTTSLLAGSTGIPSNQTLGASIKKDVASHPAVVADELSTGRVTFAEAVATDRGSANAAADAPAGPAAAADSNNTQSWKETAENVAKKIADVMPNSAKTEESVRNLQQAREGHGHHAGRYC